MEKLIVENIVSGYGKGADIVKEVSLELERGSFACILGANGCGKTTLLKTILGLIPARKGLVSCGGVNILGLKEPERAKYIAYIPQAHSSPFPFTVEDVVRMGRTPHLGQLSMEKKEDIEIANTCMEQVGILHLAKIPYTQLSGGQQQLVIIARALAQESSFLVMDEPCSNLDYKNQYHVLGQIKELCVTMGLGVLMVTHDPSHCFFAAHRVLLMEKGRVLVKGEPKKVMTKDNLERLYGLPVIVAPLMEEGEENMVCIPKKRKTIIN